MSLRSAAATLIAAATLTACNGSILPTASIVTATEGAKVAVTRTDRYLNDVFVGSDIGHVDTQPTVRAHARVGSLGVTITGMTAAITDASRNPYGVPFDAPSSSLNLRITSGFACPETVAPAGNDCPVTDKATVPATGREATSTVNLLRSALTGQIATDVAGLGSAGTSYYYATITYTGVDANGRSVTSTEANVPITVSLAIQEQRTSSGG